MSFKKNENDLQEVCTTVNLTDPILRTRITLPGKSKTCEHIAPFDLKVYLEFNKKSPYWKCPVCSKKLYWDDLFVDSYMQEILSLTKTDEIELKPDGTWTEIPVGGKRKQDLNLAEEELPHKKQKSDESNRISPLSTNSNNPTPVTADINAPTETPIGATLVNARLTPNATPTPNATITPNATTPIPSTTTPIPSTTTPTIQPTVTGIINGSILPPLHTLMAPIPSIQLPIDMLPVVPKSTRICESCKKVDVDMLRCSRCKAVQYCGKYTNRMSQNRF